MKNPEKTLQTPKNCGLHGFRQHKNVILSEKKNRDKTELQKLLFFCSKNLQKVKDLKCPEIGTFKDVLNLFEDEENMSVLILRNFWSISYQVVPQFFSSIYAGLSSLIKYCGTNMRKKAICKISFINMCLFSSAICSKIYFQSKKIKKCVINGCFELELKTLSL